MRRVFVIKKNKWKEIPFSRLRKGNVFKLYEVDLTPVVTEKGTDTFIATSDAYMKDSVLTIMCDGYSVNYLSDEEQKIVDEAIAQQKEVIRRIEGSKRRTDTD